MTVHIITLHINDVAFDRFTSWWCCMSSLYTLMSHIELHINDVTLSLYIWMSHIIALHIDDVSCHHFIHQWCRIALLCTAMSHIIALHSNDVAFHRFTQRWCHMLQSSCTGRNVVWLFVCLLISCFDHLPWLTLIVFEIKAPLLHHISLVVRTAWYAYNQNHHNLLTTLTRHPTLSGWEGCKVYLKKQSCRQNPSKHYCYKFLSKTLSQQFTIA